MPSALRDKCASNCRQVDSDSDVIPEHSVKYLTFAVCDMLEHEYVSRSAPSVSDVSDFIIL